LANKNVKLLQYADDTNGIVRDTKSAEKFLDDVAVFGLYSGLKLNKDKTEAMWLGKYRNSKEKPLGIKWPENPLKILGVYCSYDIQECNKLNFETRIDKCKKVINEWKSRNLTMIGRIQILKTFIVSQFLYIVSATVMPERYVTTINNLIVNFVWKGRKAKLARDILYKDVENGGLNVPEMRTLLSVSNIKWVKRYLDKTSHYWKSFLEYFYAKCKLDLPILLQSNYGINNLKKVKNKIPTFYINIVCDWLQFVSTKVPRSQFIWYNKDIKIDNKPIFMRDFCEVGVRYVSDIINHNGK